VVASRARAAPRVDSAIGVVRLVGSRGEQHRGRAESKCSEQRARSGVGHDHPTGGENIPQRDEPLHSDVWRLRTELGRVQSGPDRQDDIDGKADKPSSIRVKSSPDSWLKIVPNVT
jgi:hypothetical protein